jgi:hypothetical protein
VDFKDLHILMSEWMQEEECMANKYLTFDGPTGYITVSDNDALDVGTGDFSVCFWGYNVREGGSVFTNKFDDNGDYTVEVFGIGDVGITTYSGVVPVIAFTSIGNTGINSWLHFVITRSGTVVKIYVNGVSKTVTGSADSGNLNNSGDLKIGQFFNGSLDDLRIYKSALTEAEVAEIYGAGKGTKYAALSTGTKASAVFEFDEGTGTHTHSTVITTEAALQGDFTGGVTWESGGTDEIPAGGGAGGTMSEIDDSMWNW